MEKKEKKGKCTNEISRRKFIESAGLIAGGDALLGAASLVTSGRGNTSGICPTQANIEYRGECICPNCGESAPHSNGVPARLISCPKCEPSMIRSV